MPEAKFWKDALGFVTADMEAIIAEMLANEDCEAVGSARKEGDMVPDSELRLLEIEDVVVEADKVPLRLVANSCLFEVDVGDGAEEIEICCELGLGDDAGEAEK